MWILGLGSTRAESVFVSILNTLVTVPTVYVFGRLGSLHLQIHTVCEIKCEIDSL